MPNREELASDEPQSPVPLKFRTSFISTIGSPKENSLVESEASINSF